jgi:methyltransferase (TIGR00027 family)
MSNNVLKNKVSQMASYTCFFRACADVEKNECCRGPDSMAKVFIPLLPKVLFLKCSPLRNLAVKKIAPRGVYEYVSARTRLFDEVFGKAIDEVFPQIVILGAGFDTRAWRFTQRNRGTRVFELDSPVTQEMKRKLLAQKGVTCPEEITFVPIDFEEQDIAEVLDKAGYRTDLKTLFLLEGVVMYLTAEAVDTTLGFIRENDGAGSLLIFDYIIASVLRRESNLYGEDSIHKTVFKTGEDWHFGIDAGKIDAFLAEHGLKLVRHYYPGELQKEFLTDVEGKIYGRINETHCIALAAVAEKN